MKRKTRSAHPASSHAEATPEQTTTHTTASRRTDRLRFRPDGTFRVLQLADIQDGPNVHPDTIRLIRAAIRESKPDLIVLTGDQIRGYDAAYIDTFVRRRGQAPGTGVRAVTKLEAWLNGITPKVEEARKHGLPDPTPGELKDDAVHKVRSTFQAFLEPIIEAGVPFAATYGNHDFQCGVSNAEQDDIYREFDGCMNPKSTGASDTDPLALEPGTFALPVSSSDGKRIAMSVMLVDSGDYADQHTQHADGQRVRRVPKLDIADSDGYGTPSPQAVAWLGDVERDLGASNGDGKPVPSIVFQHIAPVEFYDCLSQVPVWTPNAVEGTRSRIGRYYVLNQAVCRPGSRLCDPIGCADGNSGIIEAMRRAGGYFAMFVGHDHKNTFIGHVHGLDLGYTPTCGFTSYGPKSSLRAARCFEFNERDPSVYQTWLLSWGDLVARHSSNEARVFVEDHLPTSAPVVRNQLRRPGVFLTSIALLTLGMFHISKSRKTKSPGHATPHFSSIIR